MHPRQSASAAFALLLACAAPGLVPGAARAQTADAVTKPVISPPAPLPDDSRLNLTITLRRDHIALKDLMPILARASGATFRITQGIEPNHVNVSVVKTPLRDVMLSLAHLYGLRWEAKGDSFLLREPLDAPSAQFAPNIDNFYMMQHGFTPLDNVDKQDIAAANKRIYELGFRFLHSLPPLSETQLLKDYHAAFSSAELPAATQQILRDLLLTMYNQGEAYIVHHHSKNSFDPPPPDTLRTDNIPANGIEIRMRPYANRHFYRLVVNGHPFVFTDYQPDTQPDEVKEDTVAVASLATERRDLLARDKRFDKPIALRPGKTMLVQAFDAFTKQTGISILSEGRLALRPKKTVALKKMPARAVLDKMTTLYGFEWKRDANGIVLAEEGRYAESAMKQAAYDKVVSAFYKAFEQLPSEQQAAIRKPGDGVAFQDLPPKLQQAIRNLYSETERLYGRQPGVDWEHLAIHIQTDAATGKESLNFLVKVVNADGSSRTEASGLGLH